MGSVFDNVDIFHSFKEFARNFGQIRFRKHLLANVYFKSINYVTPQILFGLGIEGIIWDVDGTLMGYHGLKVDDSIRAAFDALHGFKQVILSNSGDKRYLELTDIFPSIPVLRLYEKKDEPSKMRGVSQRELYDLIEPSESSPSEGSALVKAAAMPICTDCHAGKWYIDESLKLTFRDCKSNGYRRLKKPNPKLVKYAMCVMGINDLHKVVMIGDRAFTDTIGGRMAGCYSIQVSPMHPESDPLLVRYAVRPLEEMLTKKYLREAGRKYL